MFSLKAGKSNHCSMLYRIFDIIANWHHSSAKRTSAKDIGKTEDFSQTELNKNKQGRSLEKETSFRTAPYARQFF
jgi:hypothetical protein